MNKKYDKEKTSEIIFKAAVLLCFVTVLIYECLTPMLMDDMAYMGQVKEAGSFFDLFGQERQQYLGWTGRSVAHMMVRSLMYLDLHIFGGGRKVFNLFSSLAFTGLTLLIYANIQKKKKYDVLTYVLIVMLIWMYGISFAQTILWETGSCNYLLTTTIILGFMTFYRKNLEREVLGEKSAGNEEKVRTAIMLILGIVAGWCNENTSGGCLLFLLLLTGMYLKQGRKLKPWMVSGVLGNIFGLAMMVLAPGNSIRAAGREELHSGLLGMAARFMNLTEFVREDFFILFSALLVLFTYLILNGKKIEELLDIIVFAALGIITIYSLILTVTPQKRALFGAGIFIIIALVQAFCEAESAQIQIETIRISVVLVMVLYMFFTYMSDGASLARIYREEQERYEYLEELSKTGAEDAEAPMLRPQFANKYTAAYESDITDDWTYWTNVIMAESYGFKTLLGVDRDEWTKY